MKQVINIRAYHDADWPRLCTIHDAARLDELRASVGVEAFLSLAETAEAQTFCTQHGIATAEEIHYVWSEEA